MLLTVAKSHSRTLNSILKTRSIHSIPIIDVGPLFQFFTNKESYPSQTSTTTAKACSLELINACTKYGAFYIKNYSAPFDQLGSLHRNSHTSDRMLKNARNIFTFSEHLKQQAKAVPKDGLIRGYIGIGEESGSDQFELKEAMSYGLNPSGTPTNCLEGSNLWPVGVDPQPFDEYFSNFVGIANFLYRGLSLGLYSDADEWNSICQGGESISVMRITRYLSKLNDRSGVAQKNIIGSSPHTDWGFFTVILQENGVNGLQIFDESENTWIDIPPKVGTLVVHVGDFLSLLTNGKFKSPLHRVITPQEVSERISY
ncbi:hypothetical protein HK096_004452, partial [Nowakowskiella sp. JEL0078]